MKNKRKPLVINHPTIVPFDTDLTLIDYSVNGRDPKDLVKIGLIPGKEILVYPIKESIDMLKNMYASKFYIIVWSASGVDWAKHVVKRLKLEDYVDMIITKPRFYVDDTDADEWMKRLYRYPPYIKKE